MTNAFIQLSIYTQKMDFIVFIYMHTIRDFFITTGLVTIVPELLLATIACFDVIFLALIVVLVYLLIKRPWMSKPIILFGIWLVLVFSLIITSTTINYYITTRHGSRCWHCVMDGIECYRYDSNHSLINLNTISPFLCDLHQLNDWLITIIATLVLPIYVLVLFFPGYFAALGIVAGVCFLTRCR